MYLTQEAEGPENYIAATFIPPPYVLGKLVDDVGVNRAPEYSLIPLDYKALAYAVVRVDHDGRHLVSVSNKVSVVEEIQAAGIAGHEKPKYQWVGDFPSAVNAAFDGSDCKVTLGPKGGE